MRLKKLMCMLLAATMITTAFTGCGKDTSEKVSDNVRSVETGEKTDAQTEVQVEVTLGIWPEDTMVADVEMHKGYVELLKDKNPNVTYKPSYYKYATDTFMPMVEAKTVPTVFETWFTEPQKLIQNGAVKDITDELAARGWLDKINPAIKELISDENGRVYGVPRDGYALGLMLNVELFEEAGLVDKDGYPLYPKTWAELAETAKTIKEKTGAPGLCLLAKDGAGGWHFSNIAWCFGADLSIENADGTYTANLASKEAIAAMEYVKSLKWEYDVLTADPTNEDWGTGFMQLGTGGAAMYIGANDAVAQPTQVNGLPVNKLALCPIPEGPGGQYSLFGGTPYMFSADATTEEINAALDYLEVMGKAPVVSDEAMAGKKSAAEKNVAEGVPVIKGFPCWTDKAVLDAEAKIVDEYGNVDMKMYQAYFDATSTAGLRSEETGLTQDMYMELTKVLQEVLTNKDADVAALMKQANNNYQTMLDALK